MKQKSESLDIHFSTYQKDSMNPEEFKKWNEAFVLGFFDYQTAKSAYLLAMNAAKLAKDLVKK